MLTLPRSLSFAILRVLVFTLLLGHFTTPLHAQDDDLSIPGVDDVPAVATTADDAPEGSTTQGSTSLMGLIKSGGWAMYILGAFSVGLFGLIIYNFIDLKAKNFCPEPLIESLQTDMEHADIQGAAEKSQNSATCLGQIVYGAMDYVANRGYGVLDGEHLDNLMADASRVFNRRRARNINYFSVLAQAAPMVGLLGTVSGMIKAFGTLGREGMGDPSKLAANISEALVTTASGLIIAIPAIFSYFFFRDRLSNLVHLADEKASELMNLFRNAVYTSYGRSEHSHAPAAAEGQANE